MRCRLLLAPAVLSALSCADAADPAAPPPEPAVTVTPATNTLVIGHALRLRATVTGAGARVTWTSSDASVATVDASGLVTGVADGNRHDHRLERNRPGIRGDQGGDRRLGNPRDVLPRDGRPELGASPPLADRGPAGQVVRSHYQRTWPRVVRLRLIWNRLTGFIPPELGNLAALESISLTGNRLSGPLPPELGRLANLRNLVLWRNELNGTIPRELGNLPELRVLTLSENNLTRSDPAGPGPSYES